MENEVLINFTNTLLKEKIFNCQICDEICTSRIFLVVGKGNVCSKCHDEICQEEIKSRSELNHALFFVLTQLILPCKYESKGCVKKLTCKNFSNHINSCEFKTKSCPMMNYEGCKWNGTNQEIFDHLATDHNKHVIKSQNNIFKVETNLSESFSIKLLNADHNKCLLKTSIIDNKFYYALNPIEQFEDNVEYNVTHKSKEIELFTKTFTKTVGTLTKLNSIYNESNLNNNPNATGVDIELLKNLADENNTIINEYNLNPKDIDENTLKLLECPVCMNVFRPPIYLCNNGHSICILCHDEVQQCPTCQSQWIKARNYLIEGLTTKFRYPCRYNKLGCKEYDIESEITKHEQLCSMQTYKCPMECPETGTYEFILKHLKKVHGNKQITNEPKSTLNSALLIYWTIFDSKIFKITYYRNTSNKYNFNWNAELVCSKDLCSYFYEVSIEYNHGWLLQKKSCCLKEGTLDLTRSSPVGYYNKNVNDINFNVSIIKSLL
ncbi:unnamed protein product [Brassicogethes aeneus]|uniref:RING-type E3 ubiquitin transferase n=1 Tax=Brassicogethes aeneus TaxID=1431903 RepID=A0A9P0FJ86_BRAAE|nr:unnamed protein product [Brassicogethes aeneus]